MKIRLTKTGGIAGVHMQSETDWQGDQQAWQALLEVIEVPKGNLNKSKDAFYYTLEQVEKNNSRVAINPAVIPKSLHQLFQQLFDALKPVTNP